jgi:multisubunit Na+/H+ antiporter MnhG subunit
VKGGLRINPLAIGIFFTYLAALGLISLDDIATVLHISITLTKPDFRFP